MALPGLSGISGLSGIVAGTQFAYTVLVTAGQATTPKFTFEAGAPAAVVDWGDGTARSAVTSNVGLNHTYATGGTYTVTLVSSNQAKWVLYIYVSSSKAVSIMVPIQSFANLVGFIGYANSLLIKNISTWKLPRSLIYFQIQSTAVVGCPDLSDMVFIQDMRLDNTALIQASVDLYLSRCVAVEAQTAFATPTLNLGGTNQAPSAQGLIDKSFLTTAGWIVTTTP